MKSEQSKKIAFLDRDGVINRSAAAHEYITSVETFVFNPGIFAVLQRLQADGFEFIVVTNQRGIARGLYTEEDLARIHEYMQSGLAEHNIKLLDIFHCPHAGGDCECRKPNDGMLREAALKYPIDISRSILIGDSDTDIAAGEKFGLQNCHLIPSNQPEAFLTMYRPYEPENKNRFC